MNIQLNNIFMNTDITGKMIEDKPLPSALCVLMNVSSIENNG